MPLNNSRVQRLADSVKQTEVISNFQMLQRIESEPPVDAIGAPSFPVLTRMIDGFVPGEVVVVTGVFGSGKTLFCQSLTKDFCNGMESPLWFSFEVTPRYFLSRFPMKSADLHFYMPEKLEPYSLAWVTGMIKKGKEKFETRLVFIDHLHYVFDMEKSRNVSIDVGTTVRELKRLAVSLEIVIFLVCHTTKARVESQNDMGLHLIRDSGLIACEADTGLFVWHDVKEEGGISTTESVVKICKARRTGVMNKVISVVKEGNYLREVEA